MAASTLATMGSGAAARAAAQAVAGQQAAPPPRVLEVVVLPKSQPAATAARRRGRSNGLEVLLPACAAALLVLLGLRARAWLARRRRCARCGARMTLLERAAAFTHLDLGERTEQLVGDVHYDVWECPACARVEKRGTPRRHTLPARALAVPPIGSASYRRRHAGGLSLFAGAGDSGTPSPAEAAEPPPSVPSGPEPGATA
ncbi:MAG TPA: hypothetical protein VHQ90_02205 [Thermoanaerobaculia bacterium]|nr:hypothetical protein [Thermoanaerobaculia bacterium]